MRIEIPFDPARLSPNKNLHWAKERRIRHESYLLARAAWRHIGRPRSKFPVEVRVTVYRSRNMDGDNALRGCKGITDGLFKDAITPDDSPRWLRFERIRIVRAKEYRLNPKVVYEIIPEGGTWDGAEDQAGR